MIIEIPERALVVLIGPDGSGKTTFAQQHFKPTEIFSVESCRKLVADDDESPKATEAGADLLRMLITKRLSEGRLTVVDGAHIQPEERKELIDLARACHVPPVALVLNLVASICQTRLSQRAGVPVGMQVVHQQSARLHKSLWGLEKEGFHTVGVLRTPNDVDSASIARRPLRTDLRHEHGPFDLIGDVHGCYEELLALLVKLGYVVSKSAENPSAVHPQKRRAIFVGDLVCRGPASLPVLKLVMSMVRAGNALVVRGNHEARLSKKLRGRDVRLSHGLAEAMAELENESSELKSEIVSFLDGLNDHYVLDGGNLVVAHAGLPEIFHNRVSEEVRNFALYGETTGENDSFGPPGAPAWATAYSGEATVVYGHVAVHRPEWVHKTLCIDTGCVFGGALTALTYPEKKIVQVPAARMHFEPSQAWRAETEAAAAKSEADVLDIEHFTGKRAITTTVQGTVSVPEPNAQAALEAMSRFGIDPHFLVYLPPTMAPADACKSGNELEHPREALYYYRDEGIAKVICEEKHAGTRAVLVVCKDENTAMRRFGASWGDVGAIYTRSGRPFFEDKAVERETLTRLRAALDRADVWKTLETSWVCLDAEIVPASVRITAPKRAQHAETATAARASLSAAIEALQLAVERMEGCEELLMRSAQRRECIDAYVNAGKTRAADGFRIAPFHLLATEGRVHTYENHAWHVTTLAELCSVDESLLKKTRFRVVDVTERDAPKEIGDWWQELCDEGAEGIVVKPLEWLARGRRNLVQPALKVRSREHLRSVYGPEYTVPENLERLRDRAVSVRRSLALREFALGIEALSRFVVEEPLTRVHECVLGILALESETVDPRL